MRGAIVLLAAVVALATAGAALGATIVIGKGSAGQTVRLKTGDTLVVRLAGNPTTGYTWKLARVNRKLLKPLGSQYKAPNPPVPGAGGTYFFRFKALARGSTPLRLVYSQGGRDPSTFAVRVAIS